MMQLGLEEEVKNLIHDDSDWSLQSLQGIGYKEWKDYFQGNSTLEETSELIKKNSRNFAKRQYTWFNNQMNVHWYDITEDNFKDNLNTDFDTDNANGDPMITKIDPEFNDGIKSILINRAVFCTVPRFRR